MDAPIVSLIGSGLLFIGSLINLIFSRRESLARSKNQNADTMGKFQEMLNKAQDRSDKLYDEKVELEKKISEHERVEEKLRDDLASALVDVADLNNEISRLNGFVDGITHPIIELEESQKAELRSGRRSTDMKP